MIPDFDDGGLLPLGVWNCTGKQFLARFTKGNKRKQFLTSILNVVNYGAANDAVAILVGGSFVSDKENPADFDCVIVFSAETQIPPRRESLDISGHAIDIYFASIDQPEIIRSFGKMFSTTRYGERAGIVQIDLRRSGKPVWDVTWEPDEHTYAIVKRSYIGRHYVDKNGRDKVLVTIHGIRSHGEWNAEVTLIASANGWMVAPFSYGYVNPDVFLNREKRDEILDKFRDYLASITLMFDVRNVSVIAHSFGTYIAGRYLLGFDEPPTRFDTLILTGSILDENLDLEELRDKAGIVVNEIAPNDDWADVASLVSLGRNELLGKSGTQGFSKKSTLLLQRKSEIFNHTNVIRRDIVSQRWMPLLESNVGLVEREAYKASMQRIMEGAAGRNSTSSSKLD